VVACAALGISWSWLLRGGFWLRAFRIAVVTPDGKEVSRARASARALLAWVWVPAQIVATAPSAVLIGLLGTVLKFGGVAWAADHPQRGPHDQLMDTYLVPR
jgi:hypothetical protein